MATWGDEWGFAKEGNADSWNKGAGGNPDATDDDAAMRNVIKKGPEIPDVNPQSVGWAQKIPFDYEMLKGNDASDSTRWGHAQEKYDYMPEGDEDIGPRVSELEKELFDFSFKVKPGDRVQEMVQDIQVDTHGPASVTPIKKFEDGKLHPIILGTIELLNYKIPTPIQQFTIPAVLKGMDILAVAQTGSGKTGAYMIPVVSKLMGKAKKIAKTRPNPLTYNAMTDAICAEPLVLIVCPTRELAIQIFDESRRLCYRSMLRPCLVYGGGPRRDQVAELQRGCDILIGTPGRLKDILENSGRWVSLRRVQYTILDEADEIIQEDWETEIGALLGGGVGQVNGNHQYLFFSATFPKHALAAAQKYLEKDYLSIKVGRSGSVPKNVVQDIVYIERGLKYRALFDLLISEAPCRTLIFGNSIATVDALDDFLFNNEFPVTSIHSGRTQREREDAITKFRKGDCPILITSGVSARGIDVMNIMHVINFDLPRVMHGGITEYVHRIGRTARMGNLGKATAFYDESDEEIALDLVKILMEAGQRIPDWLEQYKPEKLTFDEEEETANDGDNWPTTTDAAWGNENEAANSGAWGVAQEAQASAQSGGWGGTEGIPNATAAWGSGDARNASTAWGAAGNQSVASWGQVGASAW